MQKVNIGGKEIKPTWKDDIFKAAVVSDPLYYSKLLVSILAGISPDEPLIKLLTFSLQ